MINISPSTPDPRMDEPERIDLAGPAGQTAKQIVEVGSHLGCSTRALADNTQSRMIAVDDWYGPRDPIPNASSCISNLTTT